MAFALSAVLLQVTASFRLGCLPHALLEGATHGLCAPALWPFLDYPMFRAAHHEGESVQQYSLAATGEDGTTWTLETFPPGEAADLRALRLAAPRRGLPDGTRVRLVRTTFVLGHGGVETHEVQELGSWLLGERGSP